MSTNSRKIIICSWCPEAQASIQKFHRPCLQRYAPMVFRRIHIAQRSKISPKLTIIVKKMKMKVAQHHLNLKNHRWSMILSKSRTNSWKKWMRMSRKNIVPWDLEWARGRHLMLHMLKMRVMQVILIKLRHSKPWKQFKLKILCRLEMLRAWVSKFKTRVWTNSGMTPKETSSATSATMIKMTTWQTTTQIKNITCSKSNKHTSRIRIRSIISQIKETLLHLQESTSQWCIS